MSYFSDLDLCRYHRGALDTESWHCSLVAIGWLERDSEYSRGVGTTGEFIEQLEFLRQGFESEFSAHSFRGFHECTLCEVNAEKSNLLINSHVNLLIPSKNCVYVAPGRVDHYIEDHGYLPPLEFVNAVMACPDPREPEYDQNLKKANGGHEPPFQRKTW